MASICPDAFMDMANKMEDNEDTSEETIEEEILEYQGVVTKVEHETFLVFSVKDETGKTTKFYWLTFIEANIDLAEEYESLEGKKVHISYDFYEFFDSRINEYRNFNLIETFNLID